MEIEAVATSIVQRLVDAGYTAYFAGGWVRDHLLGMEKGDIDIATDASPNEVMKLFNKTVPVGAQFGVVIVVEDGHPFEVSSFRRDGLYVDGRHPETIEYSTPQEDAQRRDFTINGMFYDPLTNTVYDYVGGQEDLKKGLVRAIGCAHARFVEDRLRMIRAVRIACRFGFKLDPETKKAIGENASTLLPAVAMERIWQELNRMFGQEHFTEAVTMLYQLGLLQQIFPALKENNLLNSIHAYEWFPQEAPLILFLMQLFPGMSLQEQTALCHYLKASNRDIKLVEKLAVGRRLVCRQEVDLFDWAHYYALEGSETCLGVIAAGYSEEERRAFLKEHQERRQGLEKHIKRIEMRQPLVTSAMLRNEGIVPGKRMGELLRLAERIAIENDLNDGEKVLHRLKEQPQWSED